MANKKKQFDQEFKQNAVNYCLTHPELSRKECAKNLGIGDSTLYRWKQEAKANNNQATFKGSGNLTEAELENRFTLEGFVYLTSVMDLYSRKIIAWTLSRTLEVEEVLKCIEMARKRRKTANPVIIHSDRGVHYTSKLYKKLTAGLILSYSKKGTPWDNACIESFHSVIKREWLNRTLIYDYDHAYDLCFEYIETFYNTIRIHSHCGYESPNQYENNYYSKH